MSGADGLADVDVVLSEDEAVRGIEGGAAGGAGSSSSGTTATLAAASKEIELLTSKLDEELFRSIGVDYMNYVRIELDDEVGAAQAEKRERKEAVRQEEQSEARVQSQVHVSAAAAAAATKVLVPIKTQQIDISQLTNHTEGKGVEVGLGAEPAASELNTTHCTPVLSSIPGNESPDTDSYSKQQLQPGEAQTQDGDGDEGEGEEEKAAAMVGAFCPLPVDWGVPGIPAGQEFSLVAAKVYFD